MAVEPLPDVDPADPSRVIVAASIVKSYARVTALRGASLSVGRGEAVAVIGPNGAGKSTLFGVIASELRATSGTVRVLGRRTDLWSPSRLTRLGVGRTFQVARVFTEYTVRQHLVLAVRAADGHALRGWPRFDSGRRLNERIEATIAEVGLEHTVGLRAAQLSHGDRKRLELAMTLAQAPSVLLLDEPTAGMSRQDGLEVLEILRAVRHRRPGLSVLITSHDMDVVFGLAERVVLMAEGRVEAEGTPQEIQDSEQARALYLGTTGAPS
jgi:branched-chain amino acid transport system ATP-binding protein